MATVVFNNVTKRYPDGTLALKNFDLKIRDGEFVVLVGPSGCGKSTALRLLAGLEDITEGEISIDSKVANTLSPQQRNIAMVFQNYALYPHMTVFQNLEFPLKMSGIKKHERTQKIQEIAAMLNLTDQLERKPAQLSGGQRQRVAMGRALVRNPTVFLLDEPLSNLDAKQRAQIRAEISQLQKQLGKTTLYVTHDQVEAMTLGDRVAVLEEGRLHQVDTPSELYTNPSTTFVARFIGSPGMNILPAMMHADSAGGLRVEFGKCVVEMEKTINVMPESSEPQKIQVGFRPEAIRINATDNDVELQVDVVSTEFLGHETLLYFHLENIQASQQLIARIPGRYSATDKKMSLYLSRKNLYCFNQAGKAF